MVECLSESSGGKREVKKARRLATLLDVSFAAVAAVSALFAIYVNIPHVPAAKPASAEEQSESQFEYFPSPYFNQPAEILKPGLLAAQRPIAAIAEETWLRRASD